MMARRKFLRRYYRNPGELAEDLAFLRRHRTSIRPALREQLSADFRERLMLVVTEVNGCRYCSTFHAGNALAAGISQEELAQLLRGLLPQDAPPDQFPALVYAHQWACQDGRPVPGMDERLEAQYGHELALAILIALRMIRIGNLLGNNFDFLLFRLTFGLVGSRKDESRFGHAVA